VSAIIKHRSGIASATLYYRTDTLQPYTSIPMTQGFNPVYWLADIPAQTVGTTIHYYVQGIASSGKQQVRPMPAPAGYCKFDVLGPVAVNSFMDVLSLEPVFPNPSKGITCIPVNSVNPLKISVTVTDVTGRIKVPVFDGFTTRGQNRYFINTQSFASGMYLINILSEAGSIQQKLMVR
ncbi:MAG: T9SS type A sorting domain-containing protein, partial [Saprospiraceae bacterium]